MTSRDPRLVSVRTTCAYCGVGCGVIASPDGLGGAAISGDPDHPANFGRLCSKGSALGETLGLQDRLLHPMIKSADRYRRASWESALDHVASSLRATIDQHGPDAVAFYLSGQLLTEDYYVANKLMKGFVGSSNVDTNSRLCMASSVAGHRRAFGSDTVPGLYEDLDEAELIVLTGSNAAWCHPVLHQRMQANRAKNGTRIVVIDPRQTATSDEADLVLRIKPGMDGALFSGLLVYLARNGDLNMPFIEQYTDDFDAAIARAKEIAPDIATTARLCGLREADVAIYFQWFSAAHRVVTCYSQGVNQSAQGTDKVNAIINCHLATGRIGLPGMGPLSLTGQPNAMGGREVGGLANQLAAHMNFDASGIDKVQRFWSAPNMATSDGLKAVQMFEAIKEGRIKALWVMGTNPAVSLPNADSARAALAALDLFVVSDNVASNDTINAGAHVLLPALAWGEKSGTVTNSERRISRQRAFLPPPGEAKPDWWMMCQVAKRLGFGPAFAYASDADIFREHAALSSFENNGTRDFDIGALKDLSEAAYATLRPTLWPCPSGQQTGKPRFFSNGGFFTGNRRARFIAIDKPALSNSAPTTSRSLKSLIMNTGRIRDQWHTMTRSGMSPKLSQHLFEPFIEIHPADATSLHLAHGQFARLRNEHGSAVLKVSVTETQQEGSAFVPIHWSAETASSARIGALVKPYTDPYSGQPEAKAARIWLSPVAFPRRTIVLSRNKIKLPDAIEWSRGAISGGHAYWIADHMSQAQWSEVLFGHDDDIVEMVDEGGRQYRAAKFNGETLELCIFSAPFETAPSLSSLSHVFDLNLDHQNLRRLILSGKAPGENARRGPVVCACFGVGQSDIVDCISANAKSVEEIGVKLRAGTNCGSCIPEIRKLIKAAAAHSA